VTSEGWKFRSVTISWFFHTAGCQVNRSILCEFNYKLRWLVWWGQRCGFVTSTDLQLQVLGGTLESFSFQQLATCFTVSAKPDNINMNTLERFMKIIASICLTYDPWPIKLDGPQKSRQFVQDCPNNRQWVVRYISMWWGTNHPCRWLMIVHYCLIYLSHEVLRNRLTY